MIKGTKKFSGKYLFIYCALHYSILHSCVCFIFPSSCFTRRFIATKKILPSIEYIR